MHGDSRVTGSGFALCVALEAKPRRVSGRIRMPGAALEQQAMGGVIEGPDAIGIQVAAAELAVIASHCMLTDVLHHHDFAAWTALGRRQPAASHIVRQRSDKEMVFSQLASVGLEM